MEPVYKHDVQPAACAAHINLNAVVFQGPRELLARVAIVAESSPYGLAPIRGSLRQNSHCLSRTYAQVKWFADEGAANT